MALRPTNDAALLQEVDEAVRKDRLDSIMQRYGRLIIGGVIAALIALAGYFYWTHQQEANRGMQAEALLAAFEQTNSAQSADAAVAALQPIANGSDTTYAATAMLAQANARAQAGDLKAAAALLAKIASDTRLDPAMRDMALIRQTALEFDKLKPEAVIARLKPIVDAKDPVSSWFASAAELTAVAHYQLGQFDRAGDLYARIAKLPDVTQSLQSRTVQMAGMLGVDAVSDGAAADGAARAGPNQTTGAAPPAADTKAEKAK